MQPLDKVYELTKGNPKITNSHIHILCLWPYKNRGTSSFQKLGSQESEIDVCNKFDQLFQKSP